jgi:hypothetical protein
MSWSQVFFLALLWFLATFPVAVLVGRAIETPDNDETDRAVSEREGTTT